MISVLFMLDQFLTLPFQVTCLLQLMTGTNILTGQSDRQGRSGGACRYLRRAVYEGIQYLSWLLE